MMKNARQNAEVPSDVRVQSLARGLAILTEIARSNGRLTAKDLSERVGISRQTTYHLLHTLRSCGYVEKDGDQSYSLGLAVGPIAASFRDEVRPPAVLAEQLRRLASETGEACTLSTWRGDDVVVIAHVPGEHAVSVQGVDVGQHGKLHARASGKLLLAIAAPQDRERIVARLAFEPSAANTIRDRAALEAELERILEDGYAIDDNEFAPGISCVAASVSVASQPFALTLLAPTSRFVENRDAYVSRVLEAAKIPSTGPRS